MQSQITDYNFYKSANNLTLSHLRANIYENIHLLGSLLNCVDNMILSDKCKKKIKNYKNYPQAKLWIGYEKHLLKYIELHLLCWFNRGYKSKVNILNFDILLNKLFKNKNDFYFKQDNNIPDWITSDLIKTHRSILIQKEMDKNNKIKQEYKKTNNIKSLKKISYHYGKLWPDCPIDLKMKYDWRKCLNIENIKSIKFKNMELFEK